MEAKAKIKELIDRLEKIEFNDRTEMTRIREEGLEAIENLQLEDDSIYRRFNDASLIAYTESEFKINPLKVWNGAVRRSSDILKESLERTI